MKQPNLALASLIREAGFSHKGLARRVVETGRAYGHTDLRYDHSSVIRWLAGEQPRDPVPELIAQVFTVALGRTITPADLGMRRVIASASVGLELLPVPEQVVAATATLGGVDGNRHRVVRESGFSPGAYSAAALRWLTLPDDHSTMAHGRRRVGASEVEAIRGMTQTFREADNRLGGGTIRSAVVAFLVERVVPLLDGGRHTEQVGRALFSAAAESAQLAGWLAYDAELHGLAQRYLIQALAMARLAGDDGLSGEILAAMSHQAVYLAQPAQAIDLARTAQIAARHAGLPVLLTECLVMEAHGHAAHGDARACTRALSEAERTFDQATRSGQPAWLAYFDEAYLAAKFAHCFRDLGQGELAERYARQSLHMDGRYVRGKAFNLALLGTALATQGQVEEACHQGRQVVDLAAGLDSARVLTYLRDLTRRLAKHADQPMVGDLTAYATDRLPARQQRAARR